MLVFMGLLCSLVSIFPEELRSKGQGSHVLCQGRPALETSESIVVSFFYKEVKGRTGTLICERW